MSDKPIICSQLPTNVYDAIRRVTDTGKVENAFIDAQTAAIHRFCEAVEREAEVNMLKTGKLEGAHYAAMRRLRASL